MEMDGIGDALQQRTMSLTEEAEHAKHQYLARLREAALHCYQSSEARHIEGSEASAKEFLAVLEDAVNFFKSLSESEDTTGYAFEILGQARSILTSSDPQGQVLLDTLSLDLPRVIVNYMDISENCREVCGSIITHMCQSCKPHEMVSVLCEALSCLCETSEKLTSCLSLLNGFSIVICRIQRRPVENVKGALPMILSVGKIAASTLSDDDSKDVAVGIFEKLIAIALSLEEVYKKQLVDEKKQQLWSILVLYTLQLLALISKDGSIVASKDNSRAPTFILQLSEILADCRLSYLGLITGEDVEAVCHLLDKDKNDKFVENILLVNAGAILAVLWGYVFVDVAMVFHEDVNSLLKKLQNCQSGRIRALSNMRYLLSSLDYPWQIKKYMIDFLLAMFKADSTSTKDCDEEIDWSAITPSLFSLLQAVQQIMVYAPDSEQRKKSFDSLTKILEEIPCHERFDILKALIVNTNYPSMAALLLGIVRNEIANTIQTRSSSNDSHSGSPFISGEVLDLVGFFLKPQKGGPPDLPGQCDAVLAALNLYRFLLMIESHGKMNYAGVLSKSSLEKAHSEWLLPLRVLISGIRSENANDYSEFANSTMCALNPIELALYHCIELVEESLKHCA